MILTERLISILRDTHGPILRYTSFTSYTRRLINFNFKINVNFDFFDSIAERREVGEVVD